MKMGGVSIQVEEGITIKKVRQVGMRKVRVYLKGVTFAVADREVLALGNCLGEVSKKGVRYELGDEQLPTMTRFMDVDLKKGQSVPPKILLGNRAVKFQGVEIVSDQRKNV